MHIPTWPELSSIGDSKIFKTSYFWLLIVPILAKVISKLRNFSTNNPDIIWVKVISENLTLPFNWTIFYLSSVAFGFGILLYTSRCPSLIRKYKSFSEFNSCGDGEDALISFYSTWLRKGGKIYGHDGKQVSQDDAVTQLYETKCIPDIPLSQRIGGDPAWEVVSSFQMQPTSTLNEWYYLMTKQMCRDKIISRIFVTLFFVIGFIFLAWVLVQNFIYVYEVAFL